MKPGSWWREAVVVLAPDVRGEQVVERRDRPPPRDLARDLQPLRVLVEHRVDDVDERLVAVEQAVAAGEQVALEPALAEVLGQDLHHAAVGREVVVAVGRRSAIHARSVASNTAPSRFDAVSSGPKSAEVARPALRAHDVAQEARRARASPRSSVVAGRRHVDRVVAEVGQLEVAQQQAAVGVRVRAHAPLARGRERARAPGAGAPCVVEQLLGPVASAATPRAARGAPGCSRSVGERHLVRARTCPRPAGRRPPSGRSSPSACAARSSASAGARGRRLARAAPGSRRSRRAPRRASPASRWCIARRVVARRRRAARSRSPRAALAARPRRDAREHRRVGDLVAVEVQDRQHGAVARRVRGTCSSASSRPAGRSRPRRRRPRSRRAGPGCRTPRRRRATSA